jgi:NADPH:quinone reductase-like Zn-dependent oxidoreductase
MRAIVQDGYGPPDGLELREVDTPTPGPGEVLVRVQAAGVDQGVWHLMAGLPYLIRVMGFGFRRPKVPTPGTDVAGRVEAVGSGVTRFASGDEVFGSADGSFAEYVCDREARFAHAPVNVGVEQAGAVAASGITALQAVRDQGEVAPGQTVLVIGASGGVGSFAVQIAKADGAEVTGVCSTANLDLVRSIGADHVIDYTREDIADGRRFDVIIDTAGNRSLRRLRRALAPDGTLVIVGGEGGGRWLGGTQRMLAAGLLSPFVGQRLRTFVAKESTEDLLTLKELIEAGKVTPVVGATFPLQRAPDAIRNLREGHSGGKTVVTV